MIRYALRCDRSHDFESWFQSSAAYDQQVKRKLVTCPICGSAKVDKAIMAPRIVGKKGRGRATPPPEPAATTTAPEAAQSAPTSLLMAQERELRAKLKELGMLTRDAREHERKKYGQKGARKRFQFSKR